MYNDDNWIDKVFIAFGILLVLIIVFGTLIAIGSPGNVDYVKERAVATWEDHGFNVIAYQGYQWHPGGYGTPYGGACVYYTLEKIEDNGILYEGCLRRWGDNLEVYDLEAKDAIKPNN